MIFFFSDGKVKIIIVNTGGRSPFLGVTTNLKHPKKSLSDFLGCFKFYFPAYFYRFKITPNSSVFVLFITPVT